MTTSYAPVYHASGCLGVAFYFTVEPYEGMEMLPHLVAYKNEDGGYESPPSSSMALCQTCEDPLGPGDLSLKDARLGPLTRRA